MFGRHPRPVLSAPKPEDGRRLLEEVVRDLARAGDVSQFRVLAAARFRGLAVCPGAIFFDRTPDGASFVAAGHDGAIESSAPAVAFSARGPFAKWLRVNEETLVLAHRPDVVAYLEQDERDGLSSLSAIAGVPLVTAGRLSAIIVLTGAASHAIGRELAHLLSSCGRQAAVVAGTVARHAEERARLEAQARVQQLAVAGQLAAAVAHEVRNPLTTIRSSVQYVIESQADWSRKAPLLQQVMNEVDRINWTISGVLGLSRPKALELADVDLRDVVDASLGLCQPYLDHHHLQLIRPPLDQPLPVRGDVSQLRQVLLNVILNACQATADGGSLKITGEIDASGEMPAAVLRIDDTGAGIPPDALARVFEPFFTTKSNGTGLGLPICHDIMHRHDGAIRIESHVGVGTTVRLSLPLRKS